MLDVAIGKSQTLQKVGNNYIANVEFISREGTKLRFSLEYTSDRLPLFENGNGLIDIDDDTNSYYYSFTHFRTKGYIQIGNETFEIDPEQSLSWMDHQWGDFELLDKQWEWASVQLKNGIELDLAVFWDATTKKAIPKWANIVMQDGSRIYLNKSTDFTYENHGVPPGLKHPLEYDLSIPSIQLQTQITALSPGQDVNGIWEGISDVTGTYKGNPVIGQSNTENSIVYK
jgi:predicted secreted hydrolase